MAISVGTIVAKIATAVATDKNVRKGIGWLLAIILSPIIVIFVFIFSLFNPH